jgi:hypothetical protein
VRAFTIIDVIVIKIIEWNSARLAENRPSTGSSSLNPPVSSAGASRRLDEVPVASSPVLSTHYGLALCVPRLSAALALEPEQCPDGLVGPWRPQCRDVRCDCRPFPFPLYIRERERPAFCPAKCACSHRAVSSRPRRSRVFRPLLPRVGRCEGPWAVGLGRRRASSAGRGGW